MAEAAVEKSGMAKAAADVMWVEAMIEAAMLVEVEVMPVMEITVDEHIVIKAIVGVGTIGVAATIAAIAGARGHA
jgi:hypothetical protein